MATTSSSAPDTHWSTWLVRQARKPLIVLVVVGAWLVAGAVINMHALQDVCDDSGSNCKSPTFAMGAYYAVQSGLCVGFGMLHEKSDAWRLWTIGHAMVGTTIIIMLLSDWVSYGIDRTKQPATAEEARSRTGLAMRHVAVWYTVFLAAGVAFQMLYNDWSFARALYFSFFGLNSGGLEAPGSTDDAEMWFMVVWMLGGIPSTLLLIGYIVKYLTASYQQLDVEHEEEHLTDQQEQINQERDKERDLEVAQKILLAQMSPRSEPALTVRACSPQSERPNL